MYWQPVERCIEQRFKWKLFGCTFHLFFNCYCSTFSASFWANQTDLSFKQLSTVLFLPNDKSQMRKKKSLNKVKYWSFILCLQVVVVTLAFAISWLPIHSLELMNCFDSVLLKNLILSYPKSLYTVRAVTHALAYFNSCLNPYLYALLNRNFCFDLIGIIPRCSENLHEIHIDETRKCKRNAEIESFRGEKWMKLNLNDDEDDEEEEEFKLDSKREKPNQVDASCQVDPLILSIWWTFYNGLLSIC